MTDRAPGEVETVARLFHDTYERLAPDFGYRTREASAKPWEGVPEQNRALMCATVAVVLDAVRGRSRDDTVKHVAGALNAAIENASTREHFVRRIKMLLDELDVGADQAEARDDTVTLAEVIEWLCGPDSFVPTGGTAAATRRRIADALLARFGASRAENEPPPAKDPTQ